MASIEERLVELGRRLEWLRDNDRATTVFGSETHRYTPGAPLTEDALADFEREHDVTLPAGYRAYLRRVGNGGAGPHYGLSPLAPLELAELPQSFVQVSNSEGEVIASAGTGPRPLPDVTSSLARPFPLQREWSPEAGALPVAPGVSPYDGCVHLADQGCGYFDFLVVRGPNAGQVWGDYTAGDGPIAMSHDDFLGWYEEWLDRAQIEWMEKNAEGMAMWAPRHFPGIEECVALLDRALERAPEWAAGWRARGYVRVNREEWDAARADFERAAEHDRDEPAPRLQLDLARLARAQDDWGTMLDHAERGLAAGRSWASTKTSLMKTRLEALDRLDQPDRALDVLGDLIADSYFTLEHHFELAARRLARDEPDEAWAVLDSAVTRNVGPDRHDTPATRQSVYEGFAVWLDELNDTTSSALVRQQL